LSDLYTNSFVSREYGLCQIDQALSHFVQSHVRVLKSKLWYSIVVGVNLVSPDFEGHDGIMYQCNRTKLIMQQGTSLRSDVFVPLPCYRMVLNASMLSEGLFQVAAVVGACLRAGSYPKVCASFVSGSSSSTALQIFMTNALSLSSNMKCSWKASDAEEESEIVRTMFSNSNTSDISSTFGSTLKGSFRNLRYFHPYASWMLFEMISKIECFNIGKEKYCLPPKLNVDEDNICLSISAFPSKHENNSRKSNYSALKSVIGYYITAIDHFRKSRNHTKLLVLYDLSSTSSIEERHRVQSIHDNILLHYSMMEKNSFRLLRNYTSILSESSYLYSLTTIRQLAGCMNVIASNSDQSWWGAYLASQIKGAQVVMPTLVNLQSHVNESMTSLHLPTWNILPLQQAD